MLKLFLSEWKRDCVFHLSTDDVPGVSGPAEEHDLHVWPRHLPAVWGPNERVPHLPQGHRASHPPLLELSTDLSVLFIPQRSHNRTSFCCSAILTAPASASQGRPQMSYSTQRWFDCVYTARTKYELSFMSSALLSSCFLNAARKMLAPWMAPFFPSVLLLYFLLCIISWCV